MPLKIFVSNVHDGSMKSVNSDDLGQVELSRSNFILKNNIKPSDTTLVRLDYETNDFKRYFTVDDSFKGDGIVSKSTLASDAIVVSGSNHALFLPLADCIGAVIFVPTKNVMMMSHLGRHSLEQFGASASIEYLIQNFQVDPVEIKVWLSPAAGSEAYPLYSFDNQSLHQVATSQFLNSGVQAENIDISAIDSAMDANYFSHSQFLKGNRSTDGRFAILAVMTDK